MRTVLERADHVLLAPFNAQRDTEGNWTNGLQLLGLLEQENPSFPWPVLMPVSPFGAGGALALLSRADGHGPSARVKRRVLLIDEEGLADPQLPERIRRHLESCRDDS